MLKLLIKNLIYYELNYFDYDFIKCDNNFNNEIVDKSFMQKKVGNNNIIKYIGKLIKFNKRLSIMLNKLLKGGKSLNFDKCFYVQCLFYYVVIYF